MIELIGVIMTGPEPFIEGRTFALRIDPQSVALLHLRQYLYCNDKTIYKSDC